MGFTTFDIIQRGASASNTILQDCVKIYHRIILFCFIIWDIASLFLFFGFQEMSWNFLPVKVKKSFQNGMSVLMISYCLMIIVINIWTFHYRRRLIRALNFLIEIDSRLIKLNVDKINFKIQKCILYSLVGLMAFMTGLCFYIVYKTYLSQLYPIYEYTSVYGAVLTVSLIRCVELYVMIHLQFILFIWTIKSRYHKINSLLKQNIHHIPKEYKELDDKLIELAKLHDKLVDVTESINKFYGFPVSIKA